MAVQAEFYERAQLNDKDRIYPIDFTDFLRSGQTLSSGSGTHTPPSGVAATITATVSGAVLNVKWGGNPGVVGTHYIAGKAVFSDLEEKGWRLVIQVDF